MQSDAERRSSIVCCTITYPLGAVPRFTQLTITSSNLCDIRGERISRSPYVSQCRLEISGKLNVCLPYIYTNKQTNKPNECGMKCSFGSRRTSSSSAMSAISYYGEACQGIKSGDKLASNLDKEIYNGPNKAK